MNNKFSSLLKLFDEELKEAILDIHNNLNASVVAVQKPHFIYSNGSVWFNYSAIPMDLTDWNDFITSNATSIERIMQTPAAFWTVYELGGGAYEPVKEISCDCGAAKTYGDGAAYEFHATWCKILENK